MRDLLQKDLAFPVAVYCAVPDAIYWALLHWMRWSSRCVNVASAVHETVPGHCLSLKRKSTEWLVRVSITVCLVGTPCYSKRSASKLALTSLRWTLVPSQASFMLAVPARANSTCLHPVPVSGQSDCGLKQGWRLLPNPGGHSLF